MAVGRSVGAWVGRSLDPTSDVAFVGRSNGRSVGWLVLSVGRSFPRFVVSSVGLVVGLSVGVPVGESVIRSVGRLVSSTYYF